MRLLVLVIASDEPGYLLLQESQRATWANDHPNVKTIWCHNREEPNPQLVDDRLILPGTESFDGILKKTIDSIRWAFDNQSFDYLIRANLSTYLNFKMFNWDSSSLADYSGFVGQWTDPNPKGRSVTNYVSGQAISLSIRAAEKVAAADYRAWNGIPDDVAIAKILAVDGLLPQEQTRTTIPDGELLRPCFNTRLKVNYDFEATSQLLYACHQVMQSTTIIRIYLALLIFDRRQREHIPSRRFRLKQLGTRGSRVIAFYKASRA